MVFKRSDAKAGIGEEEASDPELTGALSDGQQLRVALEKEGNRHREEMAKGERGFVGWALGGTKSAPLTIAFLAILFGAIMWAWCLNQAQLDGADTNYWGTQADRALALMGTALGYIFGRGQKG